MGQVAVQGGGRAHATTSQAQVHLERGPVLPDELQKVEHGFAERMWCALMLNEGVQTADTFLQSTLKVHQQPVRYREQCFGVSRPKQTVKNVRQAVVVHQVAEDAESEAIVVI
jgi:predicted NAD/FAD-binding protein